MEEPAQMDSLGLSIRTDADQAPTLQLEVVDLAVQQLSERHVGFYEHYDRVESSASSATLEVVTGTGPQLFVIETAGQAVASWNSAEVRGVAGAVLATAVDAQTCEMANALPCIQALGVQEILAREITASPFGDFVLILHGPTLRVVADGKSTDYTSGVRDDRSTGGVTITEEAWVYVHGSIKSGSITAPSALLYSAAPTIRTTNVVLEDATGSLRVGQRDYVATSDDVRAVGTIVLTPGPVAPATHNGRVGEPIYADSIQTRVSGDVASINLNAAPAFLDSPAEKAGLAALIAAIGLALAYGWQHVSFAFAALYTRLNKPDILDNEVRNNIYDIIRSNPGISAREVHRRSEQSWGTVVYHLRQLERHHLVVSRSLGRTRNYYENHGKYRGMEVQLACLQSDRARVLARAIVAQPGITQEQLAQVSGFPQPTTSYYVRKLKQAGLVEEQREGRYARYVPHADLPRYIAMSDSTTTIGGAAASGVQA